MKFFHKTMIGKSVLIFSVSVGSSHALEIRDYPELVKLVEVMVRDDGYPRAQLEAVLGGAAIDRSVIRAMDHQYEALPWHKYRARLINAERIRKGVAWWNRHRVTLEQASQQYGVPPSLMVALIGIETHFGTQMGGRRVLDSLVTLSAAYPRRSAYFGKELRAFLNTTRAEDIAPQSVLGSFAGAVGIPQFMPTSYAAYAVDFNDNDKRDLVFETEDAIGSVANYLKRNGWRKGQAIFSPLPDGIPSAAAKLVSERSKPELTAAQLQAAGITVDASDAGKKMALLRLKEARGYRYIIGFHNFHVITRYNPSINYAMAVTELAMSIRRQRAP